MYDGNMNKEKVQKNSKRDNCVWLLVIMRERERER